MSITVDLGTLPAPEETVFANSCSIIDYGLYLEFFFWHSRPKGHTEPVLSAMIPIDSVVVNLWGSTREFQKLDESLYKTIGVPIQEVVAARVDVASPRVVSGNVFRVGRTGVEAVLELYYLSPYSSFLAGKRKKQPELDPMIRIQLPGPVLTGMLQRVDSMVPELRSRVGNLLPTTIQEE